MLTLIIGKHCGHGYCWRWLVDYGPINEEGNHHHEPTCRYHSNYLQATHKWFRSWLVEVACQHTCQVTFEYPLSERAPKRSRSISHHVLSSAPCQPMFLIHFSCTSWTITPHVTHIDLECTFHQTQASDSCDSTVVTGQDAAVPLVLTEDLSQQSCTLRYQLTIEQKSSPPARQ